MNDPVRVRLGDGLARLEDERRRHLDAQGPARRQDLAEVAALEELHHHVRRARIELSDVEHPRDVLALQLHGRPRLANESLRRVAADERVVAHELDRHELIELLVPGGDDDAHPADAEDALHPVLACQQVSRSHRSRAGIVHYCIRRIIR